MTPEKKKHPGGRPPKYSNPEDMQLKIDKYFAQDADNITITGLAIALDMDRASLVNYSERAEYFPIIKRARSRIESMIEKRLVVGKTNVAGLIFWLKNNAGWRFCRACGRDRSREYMRQKRRAKR